MTAPLWTLPDLLAGCGGTLLDGAPAPAAINGIKIDGRACGEGDLFVALAGDRRDGHDFLAQAAAHAAAALVSRPDRTAKIPQIVVDDSLAGLTRLATAGRARFRGKMVGVTGSVGKTGSKDLLAHALSGLGRTHASRRSFNNHIGVPISLATLPADHDFAIQEMGMNAAGEIAGLTALAQPDIALITRIAGTHGAFFDSIDDIAAAKAEIFQGLRAGGVAVLNHDDEYFPMLVKAARQAGASRILSFGRHDEAEFCLLQVRQHESGMTVHAEIGGSDLSFELQMHGDHWAQNALGVLACVAALDLPIEVAAARLVDCQTPKGRGRRHQGLYRQRRITVIDDSYNASPASMAAAFASLADTPPNIMVLSEMLELGAATADAHATLVDKVNALAPRLVIGLGAAMHQALAGLDTNIAGFAAASTDDALCALGEAIEDGDSIFIKGSLGSGSWRVCDALLTHIETLPTPRHRGEHYAA